MSAVSQSSPMNSSCNNLKTLNKNEIDIEDCDVFAGYTVKHCVIFFQATLAREDLSAWQMSVLSTAVSKFIPAWHALVGSNAALPQLNAIIKRVSFQFQDFSFINAKRGTYNLSMLVSSSVQPLPTLYSLPLWATRYTCLLLHMHRYESMTKLSLYSPHPLYTPWHNCLPFVYNTQR